MTTRGALLKGLMALTAATALVVSTAATTSANAGQKVTEESFGIHSFSSAPQVPAGSLRMNCWPSWKQVEPVQGQYNWEVFDSTLAKAESFGQTDLMYVFCGTPFWAGKDVKMPEHELNTPDTTDIFGPRSTSAPTNMDYFRSYATEVVKRYKGRIDTYQAWNEITSPQFYQGTAKQMATMTKILNDVVNQYDPAATVVSGSVQTHAQAYYDNIAPGYFKALKSKGWPVDVVAGHFYPLLKGGPDQRIAQIEMFQNDVRKYGKPSRVKEWDTEANFWVSVPDPTPPNPDGRLRGKKAATYLARNYIDTWRTGLKRSYWYLWADSYVPFAGVQLKAGDVGTATFNTLAGWTIGAKYQNCSTKGKLVQCTFKRGSKSFIIAFTSKGSASLNVGSKQVCPVYGGSCKAGAGSLKVTTLPIKIG